MRSNALVRRTVSRLSAGLMLQGELDPGSAHIHALAGMTASSRHFTSTSLMSKTSASFGPIGPWPRMP
jgi:hypothetical protein